MISSWSTCHKILHILMFITSFGEQNITYKCCSNFLIHLFTDDRLLLTTKETARLLGYAEQTLRKWALYENGPINPIRHGRTLRWSKAEVYKFACSQED